LSSGFTINFPFCLHLPDREYSIQLSDNEIVTLRLQKIVPKNYDERMGFRGLIKSDLRGMSRVVLLNAELGIHENYVPRIINVNELDRIMDFCLVTRFEDDNGGQYPPGSSPFDNNLSSDTIPPLEQIYLNGEIEKDRLGRLRYTRVTYLNSGDSYPLDKILPTVNKLLDNYRLVSGEYWLNRVYEDDILSTAQWNQDSKSGGSSHRGIVKIKPDIDDDKQKELEDLISITESIPTFHLLLLDAAKAIGERNYSLAIIYSITALESVVKQFCEKSATQKGLSGKTFEKTSLYTLVTVELRAMLTKEELPDTLIEDFKRANQTRNEIIHKAALEVDRGESEKAFETVLQLIEILMK
jgi:hypothetical protein